MIEGLEEQHIFLHVKHIIEDIAPHFLYFPEQVPRMIDVGYNVSPTVDSENANDNVYRIYKGCEAIIKGMKNATEVVISGGSAGALAVYLHADAIRSRLPASAKVVAMPDDDQDTPRRPFRTHEETCRIGARPSWRSPSSRSGRAPWPC